MKSAEFYKHTLNFIRPGGTSRGVLTTKDTFFLKINDGAQSGIGECALFRGLSCDDVPDYEARLHFLCKNIHLPKEEIFEIFKKYPSIIIGYEQAMLNFEFGGDLYFPSKFTNGKDSIKINGLIWMGDAEFMKDQIAEKLAKNFNCIKLKIGVDWPSELKILESLRKDFSKEKLELRVDANGGFSFGEAPSILQHLADLDIHSIEQPIKAGNIPQMKELCGTSPIPIALDEELIGVNDFSEKKNLLEDVKPQYIILKPSLCGGFRGTDEWIELAENQTIGWWITSALESNIGLNAIAQYTYIKNPKIPQGLGTGALFSNNLESRLALDGDALWFLNKALKNTVN